MRHLILVLALDPRLLGEEDVTPREAAYLAAEAVGRPELGEELERVCMRESRCKPIGIHDLDGWAGRRFYSRAVAEGWLQPETCKEHAPPADREEAMRWTTRGSFGGAAAYMLHRLPELGECAPPEVLDHPGPAALAAARFALSCDNYFKHPCTCQDRTRLWMGPGRWQRLSYYERRRRTERQCGPQPPLTLLEQASDAAWTTWDTIYSAWQDFVLELELEERTDSA